MDARRGTKMAWTHTIPPGWRARGAGEAPAAQGVGTERGLGSYGPSGEDTASRPCPFGSAEGKTMSVWGEHGGGDTRSARSCRRKRAVSRARVEDPPCITPRLPSRLSRSGCGDGVCNAVATSAAVRKKRGRQRRETAERRDMKHACTRDRPGIASNRPSQRSPASDAFNVLFAVLLILLGPCETEGWIALSKDGYVVTRALGLR